MICKPFNITAAHVLPSINARVFATEVVATEAGGEDTRGAIQVELGLTKCLYEVRR